MKLVYNMTIQQKGKAKLAKGTAHNDTLVTTQLAMQHKCFTVIIKLNAAVIKLKINIVKLCKKQETQQILMCL